MTTSYYLKTLLTLLLISGVIWLTLRLAKNYRTKRFSGDLKLVDRLGLDTNVSLVIVELRGQEYLLSIGRKDVRLLKEL